MRTLLLLNRSLMRTALSLNDILDITKIESGKMGIVKGEPFYYFSFPENIKKEGIKSEDYISEFLY